MKLKRQNENCVIMVKEGEKMKNNYIIIGDSIAYGIGDPIDGGWTGMLKKYAIGRPYSPKDAMRIHVAAYPGITSSELLPKLKNIIKTFYDHEMLNTVIVAVGINDTKVKNNKSVVNIEDYKNNIIEMINIINENYCDSLFIGLTNIVADNGKLTFDGDKNYINKVIEKYDDTLEQICKNSGIKYLKTNGILKYEDIDDGLHPSNLGHKKIYKKVFKEICKE